MKSELAAECRRAIRAFRARQVLAGALVLFCLACGTKDEGGGAGVAENLEFVPEVDRPNVVWIVLDTCRADHLSCYGYGRNTSPNIDRIAERGVLFERNYAQAPSTAQSVPNYMTGRFTAVLYQDPGNSDLWFLRKPPEDEQLISAIFSENEYVTAMFSATAWYSARSRLGRSFDTFQWLGWGPDIPDKPFSEINHGLFRWLEERTDEPFFLYVHTVDAHGPRFFYNTRSTWLDKDFPKDRDVQLRQWENGTFSPEDQEHLVNLYDGGVAYADSTVGDIVGKLEELGLMKSTIVVIGSDHGELLGEDGMTVSHPQRESYDELLHVPLIMAGPGLPKGRRVDAITQNADIVPTLVSLATLKTDAKFHGVSLDSTILNPNSDPIHEYAYARTVTYVLDTEPNRILIFDDIKFDFSPIDGDAPLMAGMKPRDSTIVYNLPDRTGRRERIRPTPAQARRAQGLLDEIFLPLWREKDALPRETPPYFRVNHPIPYNKEALTEKLDPSDNLWARVPNRWANVWRRDDLLVTSPWSENAPGLILVAEVPNGTYDVSVYCSTLDNAEPPRGSSFSFLVARIEKEFRLFELPAALPGEFNEAWLDVGTYTVSEGTFRYWVEEGNRDDNTVVGSLRFVQTGTETEPPGPDELESEEERFRALGYLN